MDATPWARLVRARLSLEGLSVGDAFGDRFFTNPNLVEGLIAARAVPSAPWPYTDDTQMALSIVWSLRCYGGIDQDALATSFAQQYDPSRKYGSSMHRLLGGVRGGASWRGLSAALFEGQGSFGNGAAMRAAPIGAYFADDLALVAGQARLSAEVTHSHPEGIAGAVAVAVAAALACRARTAGTVSDGLTFLDEVRDLVPPSAVREGLRRARELAPGASVRLAVAALGNGTRISAQDTVPYALWCAAQRLDSVEEALWLTVEGLGDRDTTCAIAGGVVALSAGPETIPYEWLRAREPLPGWPFHDPDPEQTLTLYRPVGRPELELIAASGYSAFPTRLPEQPIFYPVLSEAYATQIARDWNTGDAASGHVGFVTRFRAHAAFLQRYRVQTVGHSGHQELWVPAEDLAEFNRHIVGPIEVIAGFTPNAGGGLKPTLGRPCDPPAVGTPPRTNGTRTRVPGFPPNRPHE